MMQEMPDGRILVRRSGTDEYRFITVDGEGVIRPAN